MDKRKELDNRYQGIYNLWAICIHTADRIDFTPLHLAFRKTRPHERPERASKLRVGCEPAALNSVNQRPLACAVKVVEASPTALTGTFAPHPSPLRTRGSNPAIPAGEALKYG